MTSYDEPQSPNSFASRNSHISNKGQGWMQQRALINAGIGSVHGNNPINIVNSNEDRQVASSSFGMASEHREKAAVDVRIPMQTEAMLNVSRDDSFDIRSKQMPILTLAAPVMNYNYFGQTQSSLTSHKSKFEILILVENASGAYRVI